MGWQYIWEKVTRGGCTSSLFGAEKNLRDVQDILLGLHLGITYWRGSETRWGVRDKTLAIHVQGRTLPTILYHSSSSVPSLCENREVGREWEE